MIGPGLKKLAKENGMTVWGGVAYGSLRGYAATLSEGAGYKKVDFSVTFPGVGNRDALLERLWAQNVRQIYRVTNISVGEKAIQVTFQDTMGTMRCLRTFLDFFIPLLEEYGAAEADICAECGALITAPVWVRVNGICHPMHESCARQVELVLEAAGGKRARKEGSYITGAFGALLGAVLGALLWTAALAANVSALRNVAAVAIGFLAERGYRLAKGRIGSGRTWIIALFVALGVVLSSLGPEAIEIGVMIANGTLAGFQHWEIPLFLLTMILEKPGFAAKWIVKLISGGIFSILGLFTALQQDDQSGSGKKFCYMK